MKWLQTHGKEYAPIVVRLGVSAVFLWFGVMQLLKPDNFTRYLPEFLYGQPYSQTLVLLNGGFEIVFGLLLLAGLFTRLAAFLLGFHLLTLTLEFMISFGFTNEVFARDFGLTLATFAVMLYGPDTWCFDTKRLKSKLKG